MPVLVLLTVHDPGNYALISLSSARQCHHQPHHLRRHHRQQLQCRGLKVQKSESKSILPRCNTTSRPHPHLHHLPPRRRHPLSRLPPPACAPCPPPCGARWSTSSTAGAIPCPQRQPFAIVFSPPPSPLLLQRAHPCLQPAIRLLSHQREQVTPVVTSHWHYFTSRHRTNVTLPLSPLLFHHVSPSPSCTSRAQAVCLFSPSKSSS